jgi:hypothetical protein
MWSCLTTLLLARKQNLVEIPKTHPGKVRLTVEELEKSLGLVLLPRLRLAIQPRQCPQKTIISCDLHIIVIVGHRWLHFEVYILLPKDRKTTAAALTIPNFHVFHVQTNFEMLQTPSV